MNNGIGRGPNGPSMSPTTVHPAPTRRRRARVSTALPDRARRVEASSTGTVPMPEVVGVLQLRRPAHRADLDPQRTCLRIRRHVDGHGRSMISRWWITSKWIRPLARNVPPLTSFRTNRSGVCQHCIVVHTSLPHHGHRACSLRGPLRRELGARGGSVVSTLPIQ
jgi:hypothetical protein